MPSPASSVTQKFSTETEEVGPHGTISHVRKLQRVGEVAGFENVILLNVASSSGMLMLFAVLLLTGTRWEKHFAQRPWELFM